MIKRWEGLLLARFYVAYVVYLIIEAGDSTAPELLRRAMLIIVPLVMVVYATAGVQRWRRHRAERLPSWASGGRNDHG